jgi:GxxExxY protein
MMGNNSDQIRKIATDVYRVLGSGYSEGIYDRAMQVGLRLAKVRYEGQKVVELKYKNHCVDEGYPGLVVRLGREKMVVELKAVGGEMGAVEERQLRNYSEIALLNLEQIHCRSVCGSRVRCGNRTMQGFKRQRNIAKSAVTLAFRSPIDAPNGRIGDFCGLTSPEYAGSRKLTTSWCSGCAAQDSAATCTDSAISWLVRWKSEQG